MMLSAEPAHSRRSVNGPVVSGSSQMASASDLGCGDFPAAPPGHSGLQGAPRPAQGTPRTCAPGPPPEDGPGGGDLGGTPAASWGERLGALRTGPPSSRLDGAGRAVWWARGWRHRPDPRLEGRRWPGFQHLGWGFEGLWALRPGWRYQMAAQLREGKKGHVSRAGRAAGPCQGDPGASLRAAGRGLLGSLGWAPGEGSGGGTGV